MLLWTDTTAFGSFRMVMMCYKQCQTRYQTCVNSCELIEIIDDVSEKVGDEGDQIMVSQKQNNYPYCISSIHHFLYNVPKFSKKLLHSCTIK
jgi:hypothetical protein